MQEWDQQPDETTKAFEAFTLYLQMGSDRSLAKAGQKRAKNGGKSRVNLGQLETWSVANRWVARASAYDAHIYAEAQALLERNQVERKRELLEREATLSDQLYERIQEMLKWPLTEREVVRTVEKDGVEFEQTVVFSPAKWNYNSLRLLAETASALGRRALELPTDTQRLELTDAGGEPLGSTSVQQVLDGMTTQEIASEFQKRVRGDPN